MAYENRPRMVRVGVLYSAWERGVWPGGEFFARPAHPADPALVLGEWHFGRWFRVALRQL